MFNESRLLFSISYIAALFCGELGILQVIHSLCKRNPTVYQEENELRDANY